MKLELQEAYRTLAFYENLYNKNPIEYAWVKDSIAQIKTKIEKFNVRYGAYYFNSTKSSAHYGKTERADTEGIVIDLAKDTVQELTAGADVKAIVNRPNGALAMMKDVINAVRIVLSHIHADRFDQGRLSQ